MKEALKVPKTEKQKQKAIWLWGKGRQTDKQTEKEEDTTLIDLAYFEW